MTEAPDPKRVQDRADELLPEEQAAGVDDPEAMAEAILEESDERTVDRIAPGGEPIERRTSEETVDPVD